MKSLIDFYKNLDTFNLVMFWSVIIIILLLLIFAIIITNKNRKLKKLLINNARMNNHIRDNSQPIKDNVEIPIIKNDIPEEKTNPDDMITTPEDPEPKKEEKFVAEEHVIAYDNNLFSLPNIEKVSNYEEPKKVETTEEKATGLYQRNVLRNSYAHQTSPIGIVKTNEPDDKETREASELSNVLNSEKEDNKVYLDEVSKKLSEANNQVERTDYEIAEEENAIISYQELMQKKDQIEAIEEEESIISLNEFLKEKGKNKVYNISDDEADDEFINELKNFRQDL